MTPQQALDQLNRILADHYAADPSIRHDPFYQDIKACLESWQTDLWKAEDAATDYAVALWQVRHGLRVR